MDKKNKLIIILDAYRNELPENEDWYKKRLDICSTCEHNTSNMKTKDMSLLAYTWSHLDGDSHCNLCGCNIKKKCAAITEACPLGEKGTAKWNRLIVGTSDASFFDLINSDPDKYNVDLDEDGEGFVLTIVDPISGIFSGNFYLDIKNKDVLITKISASCSCTTLDNKVDNHGKLNVSFNLDTSKFSTGPFTKILAIYYKVDNSDKHLIIKLKGNV